MQRKLWLSLALVGLLLFLGIGSQPATAQNEKSYSADQFDVDVAVQPDGSIMVNERIDFRFVGGPFTFVFRELPTDLTDGIVNISAAVDGDAYPAGTGPGQVEITGQDPIRITWHLPPTSDAATSEPSALAPSASAAAGETSIATRIEEPTAAAARVQGRIACSAVTALGRVAGEYAAGQGKLAFVENCPTHAGTAAAAVTAVSALGESVVDSQVGQTEGTAWCDVEKSEAAGAASNHRTVAFDGDVACDGGQGCGPVCEIQSRTQAVCAVRKHDCVCATVCVGVVDCIDQPGCITGIHIDVGC